MAIAHDASSPARFTGTPANGVNITSASFTPPAGSLLVANVSADTNGSTDNITISVSGGSLTWTNRVERDPGDAGGSAGHASIWTAVQPSSVSTTVSVQRTAGNGSTLRISCKVDVWTGIDTTTPTGATGEGSSTTNNLTPNVYTSTVNNSRGVGCATDWMQLGTPTSTDTADAADYAGAISVISVYKAADTATSGSTVTMNFDAGGTGTADWNWVALELLPSSGASTQDVSPSGFASAEAFGTATITTGAVDVAPSSIASAEAFGTAALIIDVPTTGIPSDEAFGIATIITGPVDISPGGLTSAEAFGTAVVINGAPPMVASRNQRILLLHHSDGFFF